MPALHKLSEFTGFYFESDYLIVQFLPALTLPDTTEKF
jgi:hypothetical protein